MNTTMKSIVFIMSLAMINVVSAVNPLPEGYADFVSPYIEVNYPSSNGKLNIEGIWITRDGRTWAMTTCNKDEWDKNYSIDVYLPSDTHFRTLHAADDYHRPEDFDLLLKDNVKGDGIPGIRDIYGNPVTLPDRQGGKLGYYYPLDITDRVEFGDDFTLKLDCQVGNGHDTQGTCTLKLDNLALLTLRCNYDGKIVVEKAEVVVSPLKHIEQPMYIDKPDGDWGVVSNRVEGVPVPFVNGDGVYVTPLIGEVTMVDFFLVPTGPSLMIVDHASRVPGFVDLDVLVQYQGETAFTNWISTAKFGAKTGTTVSGMESANPIDVDILERNNRNVWIRVPYDVDSTSNYIRAYAYGKGMPWKHSNGIDVLDYTDVNGVKSINIHGIWKIDLYTTNTMIAVPWTWYSETDKEATDIPAKKLVNYSNLNLGDYIYTPNGNDYYNAWVITAKNTLNDFESTQVVRVDGDGLGRMQFKESENDDDGTYSNAIRVKRGNGMWLHRQNPETPIYVYGQYVSTKPVTMVYAPSNENNVRSNMIGNPYMYDVNLNDIVFNGDIKVFSGNNENCDHIKVHISNSRDGEDVMFRARTLRLGNNKIIISNWSSSSTSDIVIPAGCAFWYDRRGSKDMVVTWPDEK